MTNGEKIKEVFPSIGLYEKSHDAIQINFDSVWWNAEYKEPTTKNDLEVDCISRAKAIEEADKLCLETGYDNEKVIEMLNELPSVTPQESQTFKWCTDCKEYDQEKHCCPRWSKVIRDTVEEMKQEQDHVLDKLRAEIEEYQKDAFYSNDVMISKKMVLAIIDKYKTETENS